MYSRKFSVKKFGTEREISRETGEKEGERERGGDGREGERQRDAKDLINGRKIILVEYECRQGFGRI